jgi:hypothetical protein
MRSARKSRHKLVLNVGFSALRHRQPPKVAEILGFPSRACARLENLRSSGWITTLACELVHLPCAHTQRRVIASHDLRAMCMSEKAAPARGNALFAKWCNMRHASASHGCPASSQRHRKETASFTFPRGGPLFGRDPPRASSSEALLNGLTPRGSLIASTPTSLQVSP